MLTQPPPIRPSDPLSSWCNELYSEILHYRTLGGRTVVYSSTTSVSTSGTGEDDLGSIVLAPYFFQRHYGLNIKIAGTKTNTNGNKTLKFYIGSTALTFFPATNDANDWFFEATILFEAYNIQRIYWTGDFPTRQYDTAAEDMQGEVELKVTGECAHASDVITQTIAYIESF